MDFDIFSMMWRRHNDDDSDFYRQTIGFAELTYSLGYKVFWTSEHHFEDVSSPFFGSLSSPPIFLAYVARAVPGMGVGTAVWIPGLDNPLRVIEQAAVLDILANQKLFMGVGQGNRRHLKLFRMGEENRQRRFVDFLRLFVFAGRQGGTMSAPETDSGYVTVVPSLGRPPETMLWVGARDKESLTLAGSEGMGLLIGQLESNQKQSEYYNLYRKVALQSGQCPRTAVARMIHVAQTDRQAFEDANNAIRQYHSRFTSSAYYNPDKCRPFEDSEYSIEQLAEESLYIVGSPETVYRKIESLYETIPFDRLLCMFSVPYLEDHLVATSARLFAHLVIPRLRELESLE